MPELPEVETVRRGLADHVVGRTVAAAEFYGERVTRWHLPGPLDLADRLAGCRVETARRRGKYLWLVMDPQGGDAPEDAFALILHLGMSGQLLVEAPDAPRERHLRAVLDFADPAPGQAQTPTQLRFVDQRTFGGMALSELVPDPRRPAGVPRHDRGMPAAGVPATIGHIAPDPLEEAFDRKAVVAAMKRRHSAVKRALLDQSLVSGIGNIYADECLWRASIHSERLCSALTRPALTLVLTQAQRVMTEALEAGGTSFDRLYVHVNGASGYFDRSLNAYGRQGRPCRRCGTTVVREAFMNRSSYSCPKCQPRPNPRLPA